MTAAYRFAFLAALVSSAACTVHGDKTPPLTGPSEFALSVTVTATPDSIPQDGASQASIAVTARDADGKGIGSLRLRIDMALGDSIQDYGILSARTVTTGTDGRASAIYTAPPPPASLAGGAGTVVSFNVTPIGSNYQTANTVSAAIRLVTPGVVLPSAGTPTAVFSVTPTPVRAGVATNFDASRSCATAAPCSSTTGITSFAWTFGDGTSGNGQTTTHTFAEVGLHTVTLTVTNDRGMSASTSQTVGATATELPTAAFVFSPIAPEIVASAPAVVSFSASSSKAGPGRTLTQFTWDFGDGNASQGSATTHPYTAPGEYLVILTVLDDLGQKGTTTQIVKVIASGAPTAAFTSSPTGPVGPATIFFNATASRAASGRNLTRFIWDFGDGVTSDTGPAGAIVSHLYAPGTYNVILTVVDDIGQQGTKNDSVSVAKP